MLVSVVLVNLKSCDSLSSDAVVREHTVYGIPHSFLRILCHKLVVVDLLETAYPACVVVTNLLVELVSCENSVSGVYYDNEIAAVNIRCECREMFTS